MFVDSPWPMPDPRPEPPRRRISRRGERVLAWVIGFNLLMLLLAPIGGVTLVGMLIALLTR